MQPYPPQQQGPGMPPPQQPGWPQPPMYPMQPQPPQGGGPNVALIVGLVVGIFVILPISILVCAGFVGYMRASRARAAYTSYSTSYSTYSPPAYTYTAPTYTSTYGSTAPSTSLSERYPTSNGLIVAHYPADFAAKSLDHATIMLSKNNTDGTDEVVTVAGVENPISNDVNEFSRVLVQQMKKNIEAYGDKWIETGRRRTVCFGSYNGLEIEGTYTASGITKENVKICYFMRPNKGYEMKTIVPARHETRDLPELQSIVDATEIK